MKNEAAESYLQARARLRHSNAGLDGVTDVNEKARSSDEKELLETRKALHHTGLLESEITVEQEHEKQDSVEDKSKQAGTALEHTEQQNDDSEAVQEHETSNIDDQSTERETNDTTNKMEGDAEDMEVDEFSTPQGSLEDLDKPSNEEISSKESPEIPDDMNNEILSTGPPSEDDEASANVSDEHVDEHEKFEEHSNEEMAKQVIGVGDEDDNQQQTVNRGASSPEMDAEGSQEPREEDGQIDEDVDGQLPVTVETQDDVSGDEEEDEKRRGRRTNGS